MRADNNAIRKVLLKALYYHPDQCSVTVVVVPVNTAYQVCANSWPALLLSLAQTSVQQPHLGCLQGPYAKAFVHSAWPLHHSLTGSVAPHNAHNQQLHCNMGTILQSQRSICWLSDVISGKAALGTKKYKSHSPIPQWARRRVTLVEQTHRDFHRRPSHCLSDLRLGAAVFHGTHSHFGHSAKSVLDADQHESSWKKKETSTPVEDIGRNGFLLQWRTVDNLHRRWAAQRESLPVQQGHFA